MEGPGDLLIYLEIIRRLLGDVENLQIRVRHHNFPELYDNIMLQNPMSKCYKSSEEGKAL